jgi:hypothetical protein
VLTVATSVITLAHLPSLAEWLVLDAFVFVLLALTAVLLSFPANRAAGGLRRR